MKVYPSILVRSVKSPKYKTKEDFIKRWESKYDPELLEKMWDKYRNEDKANHEEEGDMNNKTLENLSQELKDQLREQLDQITEGLRHQLNQVTEGLREQFDKTKDEVTKQVTGQVMEEVNKIISGKFAQITEELTKCIREGTCTKDDIRAIIGEAIKPSNILPHVHLDPDSVLNCPTCGPAIMEKAKEILEKQKPPVEPKEPEAEKTKEPTKEPEQSVHVHHSPKEILDCPECRQSMLEELKKRMEGDEMIAKLRELLTPKPEAKEQEAEPAETKTEQAKREAQPETKPKEEKPRRNIIDALFARG